MPLCGCATATLSIFTARIGLTIDIGSVGKPRSGQVGGGGGAVVVGGSGAVVVVGAVVVAGALLALPPPPHAVMTNRQTAVRPIQRMVRRGNVSWPPVRRQQRRDHCAAEVAPAEGCPPGRWGEASSL